MTMPISDNDAESANFIKLALQYAKEAKEYLTIGKYDREKANAALSLLKELLASSGTAPMHESALPTINDIVGTVTPKTLTLEGMIAELEGNSHELGGKKYGHYLLTLGTAMTIEKDLTEYMQLGYPSTNVVDNSRHQSKPYTPDNKSPSNYQRGWDNKYGGVVYVDGNFRVRRDTAAGYIFLLFNDTSDKLTFQQIQERLPNYSVHSIIKHLGNLVRHGAITQVGDAYTANKH